jgi:hypothetical protein
MLQLDRPKLSPKKCFPIRIRSLRKVNERDRDRDDERYSWPCAFILSFFLSSFSMRSVREEAQKRLSSFSSRPHSVRSADQWTLDFAELQVDETIGAGGYGKVAKGKKGRTKQKKKKGRKGRNSMILSKIVGKWRGQNVAIKFVQTQEMSEEDIKNFEKEALLMMSIRWDHFFSLLHFKLDTFFLHY